MYESPTCALANAMCHHSATADWYEKAEEVLGDLHRAGWNLVHQAVSADMFTDLSGRPPEAITEVEYRRARRHQFAGPVSELLFSGTRERYAAIGATHWQIINEQGATILRPVVVVD